MNNNKLLGAVLSGGESSRMGKDKGLLKKNGEPWFLLQIKLLVNLKLNTVLSLQKQQEKDYQNSLRTIVVQLYGYC